MRRTIVVIGLCGVLIAVVLLSSGIGAVAAPATEKNLPKEAACEHYIRLKVLEVAEAEQIEKGRLLQLRVQRWYGKIDAKSLKRNQEYETQEFRILFPAAPKADVKIGDIIDYRVVGYVSNTN